MAETSNYSQGGDAQATRDGWRCTECGRAGRLEAHHEPPLRDDADPYDVAGIRTLCRACHIERHRPDDMTPGRAEWIEFVRGIAVKADIAPRRVT